MTLRALQAPGCEDGSYNWTTQVSEDSLSLAAAQSLKQEAAVMTQIQNNTADV